MKTVFFDEDLFDTDGPFQAYFAGLMASDGHIHKNKTYASISQSGEYGLSLIEQIKKHLNHNGIIYHSKNAHNLYLNSIKLIRFLEKYNITPVKSLTYEFPTMPNDLLPYFLRGYFDGDGSLGYYKTNTSKIFEISVVGTKNFIDVCNQHMPICGAKRQLKAKNCWELRWYGKKAFKIYKYLYQDTSLVKIKSAKQTKFEKFIFHHIKMPKIETLGERFVNEYNSGKSMLLIANELGVAFQTLYDWRDKLNLIRRYKC